LIVAAALSGACANTVRGVKQDTEKVAEKTSAATNTVDVKAALIRRRPKRSRATRPRVTRSTTS
jgi:predicted small secreted protein